MRGQIIQGGATRSNSRRRGTIAVAEARTVVNVGGKECLPGKSGLYSYVERVPLVMIQLVIVEGGGVIRGDKAACDVPSGFADLIGICQMQLSPFPKTRRF